MNILRDLDHTNIVRFYESFSQGDSFFIVMELVEGPSLQEHLDSLKQKGRRMPEPMMWSVFIQLTMALSYLHAERGVVHRDLNPSNIMLTLGNRVKITDFGLAQQRASESVCCALSAGWIVCAVLTGGGHADLTTCGRTRHVFTASNVSAQVLKAAVGTIAYSW